MTSRCCDAASEEKPTFFIVKEACSGCCYAKSFGLSPGVVIDDLRSDEFATGPFDVGLSPSVAGLCWLSQDECACRSHLWSQTIPDRPEFRQRGFGTWALRMDENQ